MLDLIMAAVSLALLPAIGAAALQLYLRGDRREAAVLLGVVCAAVLSALALELWAMRPRPVPIDPILPVPSRPSFPSAGATVAFAAAVYAALIHRRAAATLLALAAAVAISRVHLGHAFATDAIVGATTGASIGAAGYGMVFLTGPRDRPRWAWLLFGQLAVIIFAIVGTYLGLTANAILELPAGDKMLHFVLFGVLAFLLAGWVPRRRVGWAMAALVVLAVSEEASQARSPARTFDLIDLAATLAGIAVLGAAGIRARARFDARCTTVQAPPNIVPGEAV